MTLWRAFYSLDPWGEQRADMRMARLAATSLSPHLKSGAKLDPADFLLAPDDAYDLPDDVDARERQMMLKLGRLAE